MNIISYSIKTNLNLQNTRSFDFESYKKTADAICHLDTVSQSECISYILPSVIQDNMTISVFHFIFQEYVINMKKLNKIKKLNKVILLSLINLFPNISLNLIKYIDFLDCFEWNTVYNRFTILSYILYNTMTDIPNVPSNISKIIEYLSQDHDIVYEKDSLNIKLCIDYFNIYFPKNNKPTSFPSVKDINFLERIIDSASTEEEFEINIRKYTTENIKTVLNYKDTYNRPLFVYFSNYKLLDSLCMKGIIDKNDFNNLVIYREKDNVPIYKIILDNITGEYVEEFLTKYIGIATGDCMDEEKTHNEHIKLILKNNIINYEVVLKYLY
jgi:hypothetical protein